MRSHAFLSRRPYLPHEIVARVTKGETLAAVCREPGMPSTATVRAMRQAEPWFDAALAEAMRRGAMARWRPFDEAKAAEVLRRLERGETIRSIYADPAMPGQRVLDTWRMTQIHFGEAIFWHVRRRKQDAAAQNRPKARGFDPAMAERILACVARGGPLTRLKDHDPAFPSRPVLRRWRREQPAFDADLRVIARHGPRVRSVLRARSVAEAVAERVGAGESLNSIGADPQMPGSATLSRWIRRGGDLAQAVRQAAEDRDDALADEILSVAEGPGTPAEKRRRMRSLYAKMRRGRSGGARLPQAPPDWMRADAEGEAAEPPAAPPVAGVRQRETRADE